MEKIYEILLIVSAAIGIYASFVLLFISKQNSLLNRLLAFFWIIISLLSLLTFCIIRNWTPDILVIIRTFVPIYYFLPATCYLYYRTYIQDDIKLKKKDLFNLLPLILNLIYTSPLIYSILIRKIHWKMVLASVNKQFFFFNFGPIPDRFHVFFRLAVMLFYIFLLWKLHFSKNYREFVTKNQNIYPFSIRWINFYKYTITLFGISATLRQITLFYFSAEKNLFFYYLIPLISIVSSDVLIVYAIINPIILFGLPHFQLIFNSQIQQKNVTKIGLDNKNLVQGTNQLNALSDDNEVDLIPLINSSTEIKTIVSKEKSSNTNTEDDFVDENDKIELLIQRMNEYIKEHQPYREVEFNIQMLSKAIQVPQHHIIYIFKIVLKKSFVDFRNELRINYVIDAIKSGKLKNLTMEAISSEAGFASRTTFYAVFKKHIGITPGQYLNELGIEN